MVITKEEIQAQQEQVNWRVERYNQLVNDLANQNCLTQPFVLKDVKDRQRWIVNTPKVTLMQLEDIYEGYTLLLELQARFHNQES